jgi:hypothetical protein
MPEIKMMFDSQGNETKDPKYAVRLDIQQVDDKGKLLSERTFFKETK